MSVNIDDNHFETIENGVKYNIEYLENKVVVTKDNGDVVEITIGDNSRDGSVISRDLLPLLKRAPGSFYFNLNKYGLQKIYIDNNIKNNA